MKNIKIVSGLLSALLFSSIFSANVSYADSSEVRSWGKNTNGDGAITVTDISKIAAHVKGIKALA
jgi:hypothetical protein